MFQDKHAPPIRGDFLFGNVIPVYCKEARWDDGHERMRSKGKKTRVWEGNGELRHVMWFAVPCEANQGRDGGSDCEKKMVLWRGRNQRQDVGAGKTDEEDKGEEQSHKEKGMTN